jgi:hypothetical protein
MGGSGFGFGGGSSSGDCDGDSGAGGPGSSSMGGCGGSGGISSGVGGSARSCGGSSSKQNGECNDPRGIGNAIGGTNPTPLPLLWTLINPAPIDNMGIMAASGGLGMALLGLPDGHYTGTGTGGGITGYTPKPDGVYDGPRPELSAGNCGGAGRGGGVHHPEVDCSRTRTPQGSSPTATQDRANGRTAEPRPGGPDPCLTV